MSLKKAAIAQVTKQNGDTVSRFVVIKDVVFKFKEMVIETIYEVYASETARENGAQPEYISQTAPVDFTNTDEVALILSASATIWNKNRQTPFMDDWYKDAENGWTSVKKSMDELNAVIEDA